MARGKRPHYDKPVKKTISLPETLTAEVELHIMDPTTGQPRYGGWASLIQQLLRLWLRCGANMTAVERALNDAQAQEE